MLRYIPSRYTPPFVIFRRYDDEGGGMPPQPPDPPDPPEPSTIDKFVSFIPAQVLMNLEFLRITYSDGSQETYTNVYDEDDIKQLIYDVITIKDVEAIDMTIDCSRDKDFTCNIIYNKWLLFSDYTYNFQFEGEDPTFKRVKIVFTDLNGSNSTISVYRVDLQDGLKMWGMVAVDKFVNVHVMFTPRVYTGAFAFKWKLKSIIYQSDKTKGKLLNIKDIVDTKELRKDALKIAKTTIKSIDYNHERIMLLTDLIKHSDEIKSRIRLLSDEIKAFDDPDIRQEGN